VIKEKIGLTSGNFVHAKITQQVELIEAKESTTLTISQANVCFSSTTPTTYLNQ
jgi:hypothetical protein